MFLVLEIDEIEVVFLVDMPLTEIDKSPSRSLPFLKKRLRRITALGLRNLTINELKFTVHFTLHRNEKTVAFYTSESVENQRSPEWSYLQFPFSVQCLQEFVMRVWITISNNSRLFLQYDVYLDDSLTPDEQKDDSRRNNNSLWLEMFGYRFSDNKSNLHHQKTDMKTNVIEKRAKPIHLVRSYDAASIKRIIKTIEAIRSRNQSSVECLDRLQIVSDTNEDYLSKIKERETQRVRVENLKQYYLCQISVYERRLNSNQYRQKIINDKKNILEQNLFQLLHQQEELHTVINQLNQSKCLLHDLVHLVRFRQRIIIGEIYRHIYPIVAENKTELSIGNIRLPPAEDKSYLLSNSREREYEIEAAVGYCAHIVLILSQFLRIPLRFPIEFFGVPTIKIYDYTLAKTDYPLCPSYDPSLFQYGLYLLNRDIGQIMSYCRVGHRRTDYRKTLQNLKGLMEQYFLNTNHKPQIQLFALSQQSIESTVLSNSSSSSNTSMNDRPIMRNKRNSTANSVFSPSRSAVSSAIEMNDEELNDDDTHQVDLFPTLNTITPRLTMQFSQQQQ